MGGRLGAVALLAVPFFATPLLVALATRVLFLAGTFLVRGNPSRATQQLTWYKHRGNWVIWRRVVDLNAVLLMMSNQ